MTETTFTASNGLTIIPEAGGLVVAVALAVGGEITVRLSPREVTALREYCQHERDREVRRWRDPDDPHMIVYADLEPYQDSPNIVHVIDERTGRCGRWVRGAVEHVPNEEEGIWKATAYRYFQAHPEPEPKPWEDPHDNDMWLLTIDGHHDLPAVYDDETAEYLTTWDTAGALPPTSERITAGRRIWPAPIHPQLAPGSPGRYSGVSG